MKKIIVFIIKNSFLKNNQVNLEKNIIFEKFLSKDIKKNFSLIF